MATAPIETTRPPLNLFKVVRKNISSNDGWVDLYEVPRYHIPSNGLEPDRYVEAAAIMTGLLISNTNTGDSATDNLRVSARIVSTYINESGVTIGTENHIIVYQTYVPARDFASVGLDRQVMTSALKNAIDNTGEILQVKIEAKDGGGENTATVHFSFILNQREEYTEITS